MAEKKAYTNNYMLCLKSDIHNFCYSLTGQNNFTGLSQPQWSTPTRQKVMYVWGIAAMNTISPIIPIYTRVLL